MGLRDCKELYDALIDSVPRHAAPEELYFGSRWAWARVGESAGIAMATPGTGITPLCPEGLAGLPMPEAAAALKSWDFEEASLALAAVNASLNTVRRMEELDCCRPMEQHYSDDLDFRGKTVGIVGHMNGSERMRREAGEIFTLERDPQPGDYPDSACEYLLPRCDIVLITGSALINKTLPRLLTLSEKAYTVLTGPSVPLCPALLDYGLDRIAGMVAADTEGLRQHVFEGRRGSPYRYAHSFILSK